MVKRELQGVKGFSIPSTADKGNQSSFSFGIRRPFCGISWSTLRNLSISIAPKKAKCREFFKGFSSGIDVLYSWCNQSCKLFFCNPYRLRFANWWSTHWNHKNNLRISLKKIQFMYKLLKQFKKHLSGFSFSRIHGTNWIIIPD